MASRAGEGGIAFDGATLAAEAAASGRIDEYRVDAHRIVGPGSARGWSPGRIPFFPRR
ncbi:hypothetical protein GCM10010269_66550 [Streptomyces humidus]|uniref:Uncharacterized protein n=1 Tax=Streptomyces humidus TaxID=52259 RepID=A0A918L7J0_9ACTN|nr:hypothetical protein [Streptomyces humidus]GGS18031.1 hypothetical protein GCM10010269_66550 [Streptomyces humidus]